MKTKDSIHELFELAVELTRTQCGAAKFDENFDADYLAGPKVLETETEEIIPGFFITKRTMFHAPGDWFYEVQINDGDVRRFGLYVEMLEYLRDVSDILARKVCPDLYKEIN